MLSWRMIISTGKERRFRSIVANHWHDPFKEGFDYDQWIGGTRNSERLSEGDGAARPMLTYHLSDTVTLSIGADVVWGDKTGTFGQFRDESRIWVSNCRSVVRR